MTPSSHALGSRVWDRAASTVDVRRRRRVRLEAQQSRQKKGRGTKRANEQSGSATELDPASLEGVAENHNLEQFFYDDATTKRLLTIARQYERPVFMCNPSLAAAWEREVGTDYVLLDCDMRFKKLLKGFKAFNLRGPFFLLRFDYDVVFCDPPFANVSPAQVKTAIDMIAGTEKQKAADVYLAYNSDREETLLESFADLARMGRALGYKSVKEGMQEKIHLYGPKI
jgi:16S rRNA G966 N2-methylase RsmD